MQGENVKRVETYHELSKHRLERYAPGPEGLDWASQPDPFRRFAGTQEIALPLAGEGPRISFSSLGRPPAAKAATADIAAVGLLLELSLGLSAWKRAGQSRWALRCNPSSGNLHPTEAYLLCPDLEGIPGGVHHYSSLDHLLEQRGEISHRRWQSCFKGNLVLGLSSIHWREAWKYGARAFRYCQHDLGHAVAAFGYAAALLGWRSRILQAPGTREIESLLGIGRREDFDPDETESADLLLGIGPNPESIVVDLLLGLSGDIAWHGSANRLSATHREWRQIGEVSEACRKPAGASGGAALGTRLPARQIAAAKLPLARLIRKRRSALAFDGRTQMDAEVFFRMLDALLPRDDIPPWNALPWAPLVHPLIFVHRVRGLDAGLYVLPRTAKAGKDLRSAMREQWPWHAVDGCPPHIPLRLLMPGDFREAAKIISCHQDIAADSAFSLGMLAALGRIRTHGAWWYPRLFWEAGVIGQVLYLEAEAAGFRGTGIGCFFDDSMHQLLGLRNNLWQDLYHFTVGSPLEDPRLVTEPPYAHLPEHRRVEDLGPGSQVL